MVLFIVPTQYPNGFESGSVYECFTRRDAEDASVCGRRIIEFCEKYSTFITKKLIEGIHGVACLARSLWGALVLWL